MNARTIPEFSAVSRLTVRPRSGPTSGTSAATSSDFTSRASVTYGWVTGNVAAVVLVEAVLAQQHRLEPLRPQPPGLGELRAHHLGERLVARVDRVEQVAERDELAELELVAAVDEQLQHHLERRALALHRPRQRDERVDERRAERVEPPERAEVAGVGQQHVALAALVELAAHRLERVVELLAGLLGARPQQPLLGDRRQVAVLRA